VLRAVLAPEPAEIRFPPRLQCFMTGLTRRDRQAMDVTEFEELIDRLGEDLSLWPDDRRLPAEQLLAQSPAAQAVLEEARALRLALASPAVRAPAGLADRIVAAAAKMKSDTAEPRTEGETAES
jgi:hypothetical protein